MCKVMILPIDDKHFATNVRVAVSMKFIHWIMALGDGAKITAPDSVVEEVKKEIVRLKNQYNS